MLRSPFPGMDPDLEAPGLWPDVHNRLATIFAEQLAPLLAPKYIADLHTQIVIDRAWDAPTASQGALPDMAVTQPAPETSGPMPASTMRLRLYACGSQCPYPCA